MQAIVDAALAANPQTRLCIAAIALETLQQSIAALAAHGLAAQVTQIAVSRSKAAGSLHLMMANNPVFFDREGMRMLQLLLAAPSSGSGKTTAACALLSALKARGLEPCAFKCGPDYIDPMFHRAVLGVPSHNLDLFFSTPQTVRRLYTSGAAGHGSAVCEGAMGYYDGLGGVSAAASAWHTADVLDLPVLLVVRPKGASLTLAAQLQGLKAFRTPHHIAGVLLNDCTEMLYKLLAPMLERETGLPVVGFLPPMPDAAIESRHLGLKTAGEIADLQQKIQILTAAAQKKYRLAAAAGPV